MTFWMIVALSVVFVAVGVSMFFWAGWFPGAVRFRQQSLDKATSWASGGMSGAVYVAAGQKLPTAPLQVGVIVSTVHNTAAELDAWIRGEYNRSETQHFYDSPPGDVSCKAGLTNDARTFMAVQVCSAGDGKAACAESDEALSNSVVAPCLNGPSSCFADACAMREREDVGPLGALVSDALAKK